MNLAASCVRPGARPLPVACPPAIISESVRTYFEPPIESAGPPCLPMPCLPMPCGKVVGETYMGARVDLAEHERVVKKLERRIDELEERLQAASGQRQQREAVEQRVHSLENDLNFLVVDNRKLEAELHNVHAELQLAHSKEPEIDKLKKELATVLDHARRLAAENRDLDTELHHVVNESKVKLEQFNVNRVELLEERDILANEVAGLEKELFQGAAGVRAVKSQMQVRISDLETELNQLMETLQARDAEVKELGCKLREKDAILETIRVRGDDFERLKADNITLIREAERHAGDLRALELELRDVGRLHAENQELRLENERLLLDAERYYKLRAEFDLLLADNERCHAAHARVAHAPMPMGRPVLGVEIKMLDDAIGNRDCVVVVHSITPFGPAEHAGIHPGDILKEWDGILLDSKMKFERLLDQSSPGTRIVLTVVRGNSTMHIPVTVGAGNPHHSRHVRRVRSENQVDNLVQDPLYRQPRTKGLRARNYI